jgi:cytochrome b pre-mRNA-processing protein 3
VWKRLKESESPLLLAAARLYDSAVSAARKPILYAELGVPDTIEGRFESLSLYIILLIERLEREGPRAADLRQALFDTFISHLDGAMREMGVADLSMGKRMRKLGEAFYGRAAAYRLAFEQLPERAELEDVLARTVLAGLNVSPVALATYISAEVRILGQCASESLLAGIPEWNM